MELLGDLGPGEFLGAEGGDFFAEMVSAGGVGDVVFLGEGAAGVVAVAFDVVEFIDGVDVAAESGDVEVELGFDLGAGKALQE